MEMACSPIGVSAGPITTMWLPIEVLIVTRLRPGESIEGLFASRNGAFELVPRPWE